MVTRPLSLPVFRARFENVRVQNKFFDTITAISTNRGIITLSKARIRLENIYITIRTSKEVKHKNKWNNFNLFRFRGFPNFSESKLEKLSERQSFRIFRICPNWKRPGDNSHCQVQTNMNQLLICSQHLNKCLWRATIVGRWSISVRFLAEPPSSRPCHQMTKRPVFNWNVGFELASSSEARTQKLDPKCRWCR